MGKLSVLAMAGLTVAALALQPIRAANATVLYDNISAASGGSDPAGSFGPLYDSFSTGASAFTMSNVNLLISSDTPSDGGTFNISVLSDNSANPGSLLASGSFSDGILSNSLNVVGIGFSPLLLAANTRYWIELSSAGPVNWSYSSDISGGGVASEFFANANGTFPNIDGPYQMQISSAVPEPSSWALMILGFAGIGFLKYRRSRKSMTAIVAA